MNQTTGANNFFDTTIVEGLADDVCPVSKSLTEVLICTKFVEDLGFDSSSRILLLKGHWESLKEGFIEHVSSNESSVVATFTLSVGCGDDVESTSRFNPPSDLLKENSFSFKDALETENFVTSEVDLIKEQDSSSLEGFNDWAIVPDGFAINKAETANKIIFISFNSNVYTDDYRN